MSENYEAVKNDVEERTSKLKVAERVLVKNVALFLGNYQNARKNTDGKTNKKGDKNG